MNQWLNGGNTPALVYIRDSKTWAIRGSKSFRFVYDEVAPSFPRIVAYLATINVDKDTGASAISTTLSYDSFDIRGRGIYLTSLVQYCTRLT